MILDFNDDCKAATKEVKTVRDYSDLTLVDSGYNDSVFEYIDNSIYSLAENLSEALKKRDAGERVLSLREADILARGNILILKLGMIDFLLLGCHIVCEGVPGDISSGWHLRYRYNAGLTWIKEVTRKRDIFSDQGNTGDSLIYSDRAKSGLARITAIMNELKNLNIPLWDCEIEAGFDSFLLKPEFMTAASYTQVIGTKMVMSASEMRDMEEALRPRSI